MDDQTELLSEPNLEEMAARLKRAPADKREEQCVLLAELYGDEVAAKLRELLAKPEPEAFFKNSATQPTAPKPELEQPSSDELEFEPDTPQWFIEL
jgi:hypothetical protein